MYERSLIGLRIERDYAEARGLDGCWWGPVPLGDQSDVRAAMEAEKPSDEARIIDVLPGPAVVLSMSVPSNNQVFDLLRDSVREALSEEGRVLAGDVLAVADSVHRRADGSWLTLTLRVPVKG